MKIAHGNTPIKERKKVIRSVVFYLFLIALPAAFYIWQSGHSLVSTLRTYLATQTDLLDSSPLIIASSLWGIARPVLGVLLSVLALSRPILHTCKRTHFVSKIVVSSVIFFCFLCQCVVFGCTFRLNHVVYSAATYTAVALFQCILYLLFMVILLVDKIPAMVRLILTAICVVCIFAYDMHSNLAIYRGTWGILFEKMSFRYLFNTLWVSLARACVIFFALAPMRKKGDEVR